MSERKAIGIDLGTTFSSMAHVNIFGKAQIIPNAESERITPSVLLFDGSNAVVGTVARQCAVAEPQHVVEFIKREMGRPKTEFNRNFGGTLYSAEELSAIILKKLKNDAEAYLGMPVTDAVITIPAYFNDAQRSATLHAGQIAGFNVLQILNEPTAAAIAYGLNKLEENQTVFVFDLGGGTFDVTLMKISGHRIGMLATDGDGHLGGKDWDDLLVTLMADSFRAAHKSDPRSDIQSLQDLRNRATDAKIQLSSRGQTTLILSHAGQSHRLEVTAQQFETAAKPLLSRLRICCDRVMGQAGLSWNKVDKILLTGGMTRMPMVRRMIAEISGQPLADTVNPDEAVALGAALQCVLAQIEEDQSTGITTVTEDTREQFMHDGSLVQVTNVTSHSLGLVVWNDRLGRDEVHPMIARSTTLPCERSHTFGTSVAGLRAVRVKVIEGEERDPRKCAQLGSCDVELPAGLPARHPVTVTYRYNANQVLEVTATTSGKTAKATIDRNSGLSQLELEAAQKNFGLIRIG